MTKTNFYDCVAQTALESYGMIPERFHFLAHSESVTFCIETSSGKFLLRIHQPVAQNQDNGWQKPEVIESELLWLSALHNETSIAVQKPVKNLDDRWVTQVLVDESADRFYCSLLHWLEGEVMSVQPTSQQAYRLGTVLARLHQHSHQWQLPQNFVRPAYDRSRLQWALSELHRAVLPGLISLEDYTLFQAAADQIDATMDGLCRDRDRWGLIHADLHDGNYLLHNDEIRPIDFSRCGFDYYLYDVAATLQYLPPTTRSAFFEGYQTLYKLPANYVKTTEVFLLMAVTDVLSFHVSNPQEQAGVAETVKDFANNHIPMYLRGESFLFDRY